MENYSKVMQVSDVALKRPHTQTFDFSIKVDVFYLMVIIFPPKWLDDERFIRNGEWKKKHQVLYCVKRKQAI